MKQQSVDFTGPNLSNALRHCEYLIALVLTLLLLSGCQNPRRSFAPVGAPDPPATQLTSVTLTNRIDPAWLQPPKEEFTLGPGDRLEIEVVGDPSSKTTTVVGPDGKIYFNLLPGIDVWGLTIAQARAQIEQGMARYDRERPQISLVVRDVQSKHVWVLGRVLAPGVYPLAAPMSLIEAVSLAGGTMSLSSFQQQEASGASDELADFRRSFVLRRGKLLPIDFVRLFQQGDLSQNIYLEPDDFVYLPTANAKEIYVLGAVTQPRAVPYRGGMSVAAAIASAYGTITGAYMHHITIVRGSLSHPEIAVVDYRNVLRGLAPDLALQPGDIVYVPFSPYRYLNKYVQLAIDTFVSSAAINAGSSAIGQPTVGGAGVFIPVGSGVQIIPPISPPPIH